ncbi:MAG: hypothetical protein Q8O67_32825 [Deltaproteobacteria bacterium]|nr:hypothetical protein [Deltaproteobacteria bacterium]
MKFSVLRDVPGGVVGVCFGGLGLIGCATKKFLISPDDGVIKTVLVGVLTTVVTGGTGLIPYVITAPGQPTRAELAGGN